MRHLSLLVGFVLFYLTLDVVFAVAFAVLGLVLVTLAVEVGQLPIKISGSIALACFFGGYALQFVGHAVEKSMPVLVRHPIQAQLAAPFFTVVELFKILRLREDLLPELTRAFDPRSEAAVVSVEDEHVGQPLVESCNSGGGPFE